MHARKTHAQDLTVFNKITLGEIIQNACVMQCRKEKRKNYFLSMLYTGVLCMAKRATAYQTGYAQHLFYRIHRPFEK